MVKRLFFLIFILESCTGNISERTEVGHDKEKTIHYNYINGDDTLDSYIAIDEIILDNSNEIIRTISLGGKVQYRYTEIRKDSAIYMKLLSGRLIQNIDFYNNKLSFGENSYFVPFINETSHFFKRKEFKIANNTYIVSSFGIGFDSHHGMSTFYCKDFGFFYYDDINLKKQLILSYPEDQNKNDIVKELVFQINNDTSFYNRYLYPPTEVENNWFKSDTNSVIYRMY
jgi:hypothetical protein